MSLYKINYDKNLPNVEFTIVTPSRSKNNHSSNLKKQLESILEFSSANELNKIECIVKFDDDCEIPSFINNFPFRIKYCQYARGAGRWEIQNVQTYLSRLRESSSRYILVLSDDFVIKRPFINEILSIPGKYKIIGGATRGHGEQRGDDAKIFFDDNISIPLGADWNNLSLYQNSIAHYALLCGSKVADSMVDLGFIPSNDLCYIAIALCLYKEFNINIWHDIPSFYYRNESKEYYHPTQSITPVYLSEVHKYNVLDIIQNRETEYADNYWKLIYQAAKNIYLNMKYDNVI